MLYYIIITALQAAAIIILLCGIRHNERARCRSFHFTPGGKAVLAAYGLFIIVFCLMVANFVMNHIMI